MPCLLILYNGNAQTLNKVIVGVLRTLISLENVDKEGLYKNLLLGLKIYIHRNLKDSNYNESINNLRKDILDKLDGIRRGLEKLALETELKDKILTQLTKLKGLKDKIEEEFLNDCVASASVTLVTDPESMVLSKDDLKNEDERLSIKLGLLIDRFYGTTTKPNDYRVALFSRDLIDNCIINVGKGRRIQTVRELNKEICKLKNKYFKSILEYLAKEDGSIDTSLEMFDSNEYFKYNVVTTVLILNKFYNLVKKLDREVLERRLASEWTSTIKGTGENTSFFQAFNAYLNLQYFDNMLYNAVGKFIMVADSSYKGFETDATFDKYVWQNRNENLRKSFQGSEDGDALKVTSKLAIAFLQNIPIIDHTLGNFTGLYLRLNEFNIAVSNFFKSIEFATGEGQLETIKSYVLKFPKDPFKYLMGILSRVADPNNKELINRLITAGLTDRDLNIVTSFYNKVLDSKNPKSLINIEGNLYKQSFTFSGYSIVDTLVGIVQRTKDATYLESVYNPETDLIETVEKRKFTTNSEIFSLVNKINNQSVNRPTESRKLLTNSKFGEAKYTVESKSTKGKEYSINIGDNYEIVISNNSGVLSSTNGKVAIYYNGDYNNDLLRKYFSKDSSSKVDLSNIDKLKSTTKLSDSLKLLLKLLEFSDDFLLTKFLKDDDDGLLKFFHFVRLSPTYYLNSLIESASKACIVNELYRDFNEKLNDTTNQSYKSPLDFERYFKTVYNAFNQNDLTFELRAEYFLSGFVSTELVTSRFKDSWIDNYVVATKILNGEINKSTLKNLEKNNIANSRILSLASNFKTQCSEAAEANGAMRNLLFVNQLNLVIKSDIINTDVKSRLGIIKPIKKLTAPELVFQSIILNFYSSILLTDQYSRKSKNSATAGAALIQASTYADKTSIILGAINVNRKLHKQYADGLKASYDDKSIWELGTSQLVDLAYDTLGEFYKTSYNIVLEKFTKILQKLDSTFTENDVFSINEKLKSYTKEEILDTAQSLGIELTENADYATKGNTILVSDILYTFATNSYGNKENLTKILAQQEIEFINYLLENNINFYTKYSDGSSSAVGRIVDKLSSGDSPMLSSSLWVKDGKLIIAKVNGRALKSGELIKSEDNVEINPLLTKYFYTETALANNFRLSYVGPETGHPVKLKIDYKLKLLDNGFTPSNNPQYFKFKSSLDENPFNLKAFDYQLDVKYKEDNGNLIIYTDNSTAIISPQQDGTYRLEFNSTNEDSKVLAHYARKALPIGAKFSLTGNVTNDIIALLASDTTIGTSLVYNLDTSQVEDISYMWKTEAIDDFDNLIWLSNKPELASIYKEVLTLKEAHIHNTQTKRNVSIPATIEGVLPKRVNGLPSKVKVAIIEDEVAPVLNFRGDTHMQLVHDGQCTANPIATILFNNSLQDLATGVDQKPLWHYLDPVTGNATLVKTAFFTLTRDRMANHLQSTSSPYKLFKQMTNIPWSTIKNGERIWHTGQEINLTSTFGYLGKGDENKRSNFFNRSILNGKNIWYKDASGKVYSIANLKVHNGRYYTVEYEVTNDGQIDNNSASVVYHSFDADSNHYIERIPLSVKLDTYLEKEKAPELKEGRHEVNSIFELYNMFGGLYTVEHKVDEDGISRFIYNDRASEVCANYVNNIAIRKHNNFDPINIDQDEYIQPLKDFMIYYAASKTAVKMGGANINPVGAWAGNAPLRYYELSTLNLGIQQDSDHTIDEAELTEFSQVIAALESGGALHHISKQVYEVLAKLVLQASKVELDPLIEYIKLRHEGVKPAEARSQIYEIIVKTFRANYTGLPGRIDLAPIIIDRVSKNFNLRADHVKDKFKFPASDSNVYRQVISQFVGIINNKSIKRKYPGNGCVQCPSYNRVMTYKIKGTSYMFEDILRKATIVNKGLKFYTLDLNTIDQTTYNQELVSAYLKLLQEKEWEKATESVDNFMVTDVVDILIKDNTTGELKYLDTANLDDIYDYYRFKDGIHHIATQKAQELFPELSNFTIVYANNITVPRNLAPARYNFSYRDENGVVHRMNLFDVDPIRESFLNYNSVYFNRIKNRLEIQKVLDDLGKGKYKGYDIFDVQNEESEIVISKLYASKFGLDGKSLSYITDQGPVAFKKKVPRTIRSNLVNIALTTGSGKSKYIHLGELSTTATESYRPRLEKWDQENTYIDNLSKEVYLLDLKTRRKLFKIGKYAEDPNLLVTEDGNIKYRGSSNILQGEDLENLRIFDNKVYRYYEYLSLYKINETSSIKDKSVNYVYDLYTINFDNIKAALSPNSDGVVTAKDIYKQASKILSDLYSSDKFDSIRVNTSMPSKVAKRAKYILLNIDVDERMKEFVDTTLLKYFEGVDTTEEEYWNIEYKEYNKDLVNLYNLQSEFEYSSFLKSLEYITARIPAQCLQSFMKSKAVGFAETDMNVVYVSHYQLWLQGSDYDIDKSYVMGQEFDENGIYVGWSDLFDYSNYKALIASEKLPIPSGNKIIKSNNGIDISEYITKIMSQDTREGRMESYVELINFLGDNTEVTWNETVDGREVLKNLNIHHLTKEVPALEEKRLRNFVASHIGLIVQDIANYDRAYSPITLKDLRELADNSPKGDLTNRLSPLNPATKFILQTQNMVGKDDIGIFAVGEKILFNLNYYWNEKLRLGDVKNIKFHHQFNRIQDRSYGDPVPRVRTRLEGINIDNIEEVMLKFNYYYKIDDKLRKAYNITDDDILNKTENWKLYRNNLIEEIRGYKTSLSYAEEIVSQLLSAATDNAKELILEKINGTTDLAGTYIYLILMGFNINDICAFMTSPTIQLIGELSKGNIFDEYSYKSKLETACNMLQGNFKVRLYLNGNLVITSNNKVTVVNLWKEAGYIFHSKLSELLKSGDLLVVSIVKKLTLYEEDPKTNKMSLFKTGVPDVILMYFNLRLSGEMQETLEDFLDIKAEESTSGIFLGKNYSAKTIAVHLRIRNLLDDVEYVLRKAEGINIYDLDNDIKEFRNIQKLSEETTALGTTILGTNQGLPIDTEGQILKIFRIENIVTTAENNLGINDKTSIDDFVSIALDNNPELTESDAREGIEAGYLYGIVRNFDFFKWQSDSDYREATKKYYNVIRGTWNIFDIIDTIPHYREMFRAFDGVVTANNISSIKTHMVYLIARDLWKKNTKFVSKEDITHIIEYIDDLLTLKSLQELSQEYKFAIQDGDMIFEDSTNKLITYKGDTSYLDLSSAENRASIKRLIEEKLVPLLQKGSYIDPTTNTTVLVDSNAFIENLINDTNSDNNTILRLDLDMQNVDSSASSQETYQKCLTDLAKLADSKKYYYSGHSLAEWFMIYNLIVNKNKFGKERLTTIFSELLKYTDNTAIEKVLNIVGNIDYDPESVTLATLQDWGYNRNDALLKLAPTISKSQEATATAEYVREKDKSGIYVYKKKDTYGYSNLTYIPGFLNSNVDALSTNPEMALRYIEYKKHFTILSPFASYQNSPVASLLRYGSRSVYNGLTALIQLGRITITLENC